MVGKDAKRDEGVAKMYRKRAQKVNARLGLGDDLIIDEDQSESLYVEMFYMLVEKNEKKKTVQSSKRKNLSSIF